jgi:hypothetical protein
LIDSSKKDEENAALKVWLSDDQARKHAFWQQYAEAIQQSAFGLCPRGIGTSSVRIFDVMQSGRVPVILSDDWVLPDGPDWASFSILVPEKDVESIPERLEAKRGEAERMGRLARKAWEDWYADDVVFHRVVQWCCDIRDQRVLREAILRWSVYPRLWTSDQSRVYLRERVNSARQRWRGTTDSHDRSARGPDPNDQERQTGGTAAGKQEPANQPTTAS